MAAYYNEIDPFMVKWLCELIKDKLIADGDVDDRSITEVVAADLRGYTQCHFFAGLGGWSRALRLAGWSDDRRVWTGSPPCQPFSQAGKQLGHSDERHLWPVFDELIGECRPPVVYGEQVEAAINHGWLDLVQNDMEKKDYAFASFGLPASSVTAPHIRQRILFVADCNKQRRSRQHSLLQRQERGRVMENCTEVTRSSEVGGVGNNNKGLQGRGRSFWFDGEEGRETTERHCSEASIWIKCSDGKHRLISTEPSLFPVVNGVSNIVECLRGAGNAIVPQLAAEFIMSYMEFDNACGH